VTAKSWEEVLGLEKGLERVSGDGDGIGLSGVGDGTSGLGAGLGSGLGLKHNKSQ